MRAVHIQSQAQKTWMHEDYMLPIAFNSSIHHRSSSVQGQGHLWAAFSMSTSTHHVISPLPCIHPMAHPVLFLRLMLARTWDAVQSRSVRRQQNWSISCSQLPHLLFPLLSIPSLLHHLLVFQMCPTPFLFQKGVGVVLESKILWQWGHLYTPQWTRYGAVLTQQMSPPQVPQLFLQVTHRMHQDLEGMMDWPLLKPCFSILSIVMVLALMKMMEMEVVLVQLKLRMLWTLMISCLWCGKWKLNPRLPHAPQRSPKLHKRRQMMMTTMTMVSPIWAIVSNCWF